MMMEIIGTDSEQYSASTVLHSQPHPKKSQPDPPKNWQHLPKNYHLYRKNCYCQVFYSLPVWRDRVRR